MQTLTQDPNDHAFQQAPWRFYETARRAGDFIFWTEFDRPVAVTDAAVNAVLKDRRLGRARPGETGPDVPAHMPVFARIEANSLLEIEAPDHTRIRGLVLRAFTSRRIAALAPEISHIADELIEALPSDAPFDLMERFARPLPVRVIARLLGVPEEASDDLLAWSNDMVAMYQSRRDRGIEDRAEAAATAFDAFIRDVIAEKRRAPKDDLLSALIAARSEEGRLSEDEMISTVILLLNAGHEATVNAIGNIVNLLFDCERREEALAADYVENTVEEGLRARPPLHMFSRHVYEDVEIMGTRFSAGDEVYACLGSACHDDAVWPDPERFDPFRPTRRNTAFGAGIHFCVGAPLARLELKIALPMLFSSCKTLTRVETPEVAPLYHFDGLKELILRC